MKLYALSMLALLAGCAVAPTGPSVMALPGSGKNFGQFRSDDRQCRDYAYRSIGGANADAAVADPGMRHAIAGTLIGAAAGAMIGGNHAAGVGAGTGLLVGSMSGGEYSQHTAIRSQQNYDNAYVQCMYGKGQKVPVSAEFAADHARASPPPKRRSQTTETPFYPPPPPR